MNYPPIHQISECFIKPQYEVEESKQPYYLSPWDLCLLSGHYNHKGLLFTKPKQQTFSIHNLLETLKLSLSQTLVHFYPLAGQLATKIDQDKHRCSIFVNCNKGPGVRFVHATFESTISDILSPTYVPPVVKFFFDHTNGEINHDGHSKPLLSVQVTEALDGIFIGFSMNHAIVDGTSFWHFWNVWSQIHVGKGKAVSIRKPVHKRWVPDGYKLDEIYLPYTKPDEFITWFEPSPDVRERFFHFSSEAVARLKAKASQELTVHQSQDNSNNKCQTISSFQAIIALVWRTIIRARNLPPNQPTHCKMSANNRTRLNPPLPQEYFGNSLSLLQATTTVGELLGHGLGLAAMLLNEAVANHSEQCVLDSSKSWINSPVVYSLRSVLDVESMSTVQVGSSPRFDVYGNEFAGLGKPVAVRSGYANKSGGKVIVFPGREGGGSVDVEICLPLDAMNALEVDEEFMAAVSSHYETYE